MLSSYTHAGRAFPVVAGFRTALIIASVLCAVTGVISLVLPGRPTAPPPADVVDEERLRVMEEESEVAGAGLMLSDEPVAFDAGVEGA